MSRALFPIVLAASACATSLPPPNGTLVGNPGKTTSRLGPASTFDWTEAEVDGAELALLACEGGVTGWVTDGTLDLIGGEPFPVPAGAWCGLVLAFPYFHAEGQTGEQLVTVDLSSSRVVTLWSRAPIFVDENDFVLEWGSPGWFDLEEVGDGEEIAITEESDLAPLLEAALVEGSGWYEDDGDGEIGEEEREAGSLVAVDAAPPDGLGEDFFDDSGVEPVSVEGCSNCATGDPRGLGLAAIVGLLLVVRRRSPATGPIEFQSPKARSRV